VIWEYLRSLLEGHHLAGDIHHPVSGLDSDRLEIRIPIIQRWEFFQDDRLEAKRTVVYGAIINSLQDVAGSRGASVQIKALWLSTWQTVRWVGPGVLVGDGVTVTTVVGPGTITVWTAVGDSQVTSKIVPMSVSEDAIASWRIISLESTSSPYS
jgi:hypothetical protein